ncbi:unnamed protein product, partial [Heterobilharzia americana]
LVNRWISFLTIHCILYLQCRLLFTKQHGCESGYERKTSMSVKCLFSDFILKAVQSQIYTCSLCKDSIVKSGLSSMATKKVSIHEPSLKSIMASLQNGPLKPMIDSFQSYKRYVDDTFIISDNQCKLNHFSQIAAIQQLNSPLRSKIHFLDVQLIKG